ncbi:MAG: hypothetical protein IV107_23990 [Paucibacter sp.]|nr:hypothetical protein [Roseateles sp.]
MGQLESLASRQQAAECLNTFFQAQVAEAMPKAFEAALVDAFSLSRWLVNATMRVQPAKFGPLDPATDLPMLAGLSVPTLVVMLFDKRQPADVTAAARDALAALYLQDDDTQALIIGAANRLARQAVRDLQAAQAEFKRRALQATAAACQPTTSVTAEQGAAMDDMAEFARRGVRV